MQLLLLAGIGSALCALVCMALRLALDHRREASPATARLLTGLGYAGAGLYAVIALVLLIWQLGDRVQGS